MNEESLNSPKLPLSLNKPRGFIKKFSTIDICQMIGFEIFISLRLQNCDVASYEDVGCVARKQAACRM